MGESSAASLRPTGRRVSGGPVCSRAGWAATASDMAGGLWFEQAALSVYELSGLMVSVQVVFAER